METTTQHRNEFWGMDERSFIVLMHISQFSSYIIPVAGIVLPLVMWILFKENTLIDEHGKNIINWIISVFIYSIAGVILCFVIIGFVLLGVLAVLAIIFPIIGAVKASDNEFWQYPLTIKFIK